MKATPVKPVRCAIYTRVSTDQGLDQEFNSLDAQYDASSGNLHLRPQDRLRGRNSDFRMPALLPASIAWWMRTAASETSTHAIRLSYRYSESHFLFISIFLHENQCGSGCAAKNRALAQAKQPSFRRRRGDTRRQRRRGCG